MEPQFNATSDPRRVAAVRPIGAWRAWTLGLLFAAALVPLIRLGPRHSGNVWSRYMTAESLVERHTLAIEDSPLLAISGSPDIVKFRGHTYADKPPVLSALAAVVYAPLVASGVRLAGSPEQFVAANFALVAAIIGLASAATLAACRWLLQAVDLAPWKADVLTLAIGFGSQLLAYGVTFNNHSVAAALLTWALALVLFERPASRRLAWRRAGVGVLAGLCATIDLPAGGILLVAATAWLAARTRRPPLAFLAGAALPLLLHSALQIAETGTPLPVELTPSLFEYDESYWKTEAGRFVETIPRWQWGLELLLGPQGWLTVTPVLGLGLAGIARSLRRRDRLAPLALAVGGMVLVLLGYYSFGVRRTDFAGLSFGTRHLLAVAPVVGVFAIAWSAERPRFAGGFWLLFALAWAIGAVYAWEGMLDPWSRIERRNDVPLRVLQRGVVYPWSSYRR